ncbi:hypothetical protein ACQB6R_00365 [Propionibacteriaceae bacterium G1746]|uniref:hypothetical protein n=1 Tax=Aestuariimicrobium sp. G57 TaxID=3418485 RepID=UPI003C266EE7
MFKKSALIAAAFAVSLAGGVAAAVLPAMAEDRAPQVIPQTVVNKALPAQTEITGALVPGGIAVITTDVFQQGEPIRWKLTQGTRVIDSVDLVKVNPAGDKGQFRVDLAKAKSGTFTLTATSHVGGRVLTDEIVVVMASAQPGTAVMRQTRDQVTIATDQLTVGAKYTFEVVLGGARVDYGTGVLGGTESAAEFTLTTTDLPAGSYVVFVAAETGESAVVRFEIKASGQGGTPNRPLPKTGA